MNTNDTIPGTVMRLSDLETAYRLDSIELTVAILLAATLLTVVVALLRAFRHTCTTTEVSKWHRLTVVLSCLSATGAAMVALRAISNLLWILAIHVAGAARDGLVAITIAREVRVLSWAIAVMGAGSVTAWLLKQLRTDKEKCQQGTAPLPSAPQSGPSEGAR